MRYEGGRSFENTEKVMEISTMQKKKKISENVFGFVDVEWCLNDLSTFFGVNNI